MPSISISDAHLAGLGCAVSAVFVRWPRSRPRMPAGSRERERLVKERTQHVNRIKALLATPEGVIDLQLTRHDAQRLEQVKDGHGHCRRG